MQPDETKVQEVEDLEALLASPGWKRFMAFVDREFGAIAYRQKAQKIMAGLPAEKVGEAGPLLLQLEASSREVERLLSWPKERISRILRGPARV